MLCHIHIFLACFTTSGALDCIIIYCPLLVLFFSLAHFPGTQKHYAILKVSEITKYTSTMSWPF